MAIVIEDEKQFEKLVTDHQRALDYIEYLESLLDAAVYQEHEFNRKFGGANFEKKIIEREY